MAAGIDIAIIMAGIVFGLIGFFLGLVKSAFTWGGALLGMILGRLLAPQVVKLFGETATQEFAVSAITIGVCVAIGAVGGRILAATLKIILPVFLSLIDRAAGALLGIIVIGILSWFILPLLSSVGGDAEAWRAESQIAEFLENNFPDPPIGAIEDAIEKVREANEKARQANTLLENLET